MNTDKNMRSMRANRALSIAARPTNLEMGFFLMTALCALLALGGCASADQDQRVSLVPEPPFQEMTQVSMNTTIDANAAAAIQPAAGASLATIAAIRNQQVLNAAAACERAASFSDSDQALAYDDGGGRFGMDIRADRDQYATSATPGGFNPTAMATLRYSVSLQKANTNVNFSDNSLWQGVRNLRDRLN